MLWDKDVGWRDLLEIFYYALGEWHKPKFKYKQHYTEKLVNLISKNKCIEALELSPARTKRLKYSVIPKMLDLLMTFSSVDYRKNLYSTRGLTLR